MPILDGAEACYPVYSAIAKAVYKDIGQIEKAYSETEDYNYYNTNGKIVTFTNTSVGYTRLINGEVDMFFGAKPSKSQLERLVLNLNIHLSVEKLLYSLLMRIILFLIYQRNKLKISIMAILQTGRKLVDKTKIFLLFKDLKDLAVNL